MGFWDAGFHGVGGLLAPLALYDGTAGHVCLSRFDALKRCRTALSGTGVADFPEQFRKSVGDVLLR